MDGQSKKRKLILDSDEEEHNQDPVRQVEAAHAPITKKIHSENTNHGNSKSETKINQKQPKIDKEPFDTRILYNLFQPDESISEPQPKKARSKNNQEKNTTSLKTNPTASDFQNSDFLRQEILKRWWYCYDQAWPPTNYEQPLKKYSLRQVDAQNFKREPEYNSSNLRKVVMIEGYPGIFKTSEGDMLDLRPRETCPCIKTLEKYDKKTLQSMLKKGLQAQVRDLIECEPNNTRLREKLERMVQQLE